MALSSEATLADRASWGVDDVTIPFDVPWRPSPPAVVFLIFSAIAGVGMAPLLCTVLPVMLGFAALLLRSGWAREAVVVRIDPTRIWLDGTHGALKVWRLDGLASVHLIDEKLVAAGVDGSTERIDLRLLEDGERQWLADLLQTAVRRAHEREDVGELLEERKALAALKRAGAWLG